MKKTPEITAIGGEVPTNGAEESLALSQPYRVEVTIEGTAPLLFHRYNCESVEIRGKGPKGSAVKKTDDVESYVWRDTNGELCIPGEYLRCSIVKASAFKQDPRSPRKSAVDLFKAAIISLTELSSFGAKNWDFMDKRRVSLNRNAITRSRPAMNAGWKGTFLFLINLPEYINPQFLQLVLQDAGRLVGIGDFRPSYGRFNVTSFMVLD